MMSAAVLTCMSSSKGEKQMEFYLRLSQDNDLDQLQRLSVRARHRYTSIASLAHVAESPPLGADRFEACRVMVAVDRHSKEVIGFAAMRPLDDDVYLDNISVEPGVSGQGVGKILLSSVAAYAHSLQRKAISLTTFREPRWNGPWFRQQGFYPMPTDRIGDGLISVIQRQSQSFNPETRETLWRLL
ncbi:Acetyltransferase [Pseudomonas caricapapayae]|uniref:Acetyltransferase n=2 Tax=Pseudomonas caricapapayae TaxID=46678 RepID=A0A0P9K6J6_9PSED|nr:Acetyltransferase [Pseudomonas caricapapayae]RMM06139.1 Acetyltransferase [Pseudomonas caricapapayae]RMV92699.1 Acetyltransferase [Pseudomonas caricapapayae]